MTRHGTPGSSADQSEGVLPGMQRYPIVSTPLPPQAPLILLFERNDAVAVPLIPQLRMAGYDVRAARIPVEVFSLLQREKIDLVLIDLGNAAANRREFWVGLDTQRRTRNVHVLTFRYMATGETGELESGLRVARADVEIQSAQGFAPLIEAIRARVPGAVPVPQFSGPPPATPALPFPSANMSPLAPSSPLAPRAPAPPSAPAANPLAPQAPPARSPLGQPFRPAPVEPVEDDASPFARPYSNNPFKSGGRATPAPPTPALPLPAHAPLTPPRPGNRVGIGGSLEDFARGFAPAGPSPSSNGHSAPTSGQVVDAASKSRPAIDDAWTPPDPAPPRRGIAYRGYEDEPLAPDDPRIEDSTSVVPAVVFDQAERQGDARNERALSTILMDSAVMAPKRLDALRTVQQALGAVGMEFSLGELALLFKFLTPDQLLAALLVSRGVVTAEEIASLGRIKQELLATGKDYDLETLLVMFNVLAADEVRALKAELG
jgi:CheY-like chemotaxis protein